MIPGTGGAGDGKRSPWEWRVADPVAYKLELAFPISRFVSQKRFKRQWILFPLRSTPLRSDQRSEPLMF